MLQVAAAGYKRMEAWKKTAQEGHKKTPQQVALEKAQARVAALREQAESKHHIHAKVAKLRLQVQHSRELKFWLEQQVN